MAAILGNRAVAFPPRPNPTRVRFPSRAIPKSSPAASNPRPGVLLSPSNPAALPSAPRHCSKLFLHRSSRGHEAPFNIAKHLPTWPRTPPYQRSRHFSKQLPGLRQSIRDGSLPNQPSDRKCSHQRDERKTHDQTPTLNARVGHRIEDTALPRRCCSASGGPFDKMDNVPVNPRVSSLLLPRRQ